MIRVDESDPIGELEPPFPYREVTIKRGVDVNESLELLTEIGRGKFGTVYKCREKSTGLELAAKVVPVKKREERRTVEREIDIMRKLTNPRLIQLYDAYDSANVMYVVLELITGGELFERVIDDDFVLTEKACTVFMRQICEGIEFVHQQNILHLDMKPENILCLTKTGNRIKIIDFGLARLFDPEKKLQVLFGTPEFVAPEVVNFDQIGFGTDMWSIGVICYVLLSGLSPFMGETDIETMANVTVAKYDYDDEAFNEISDDAKDFIRKLLVKDKESRMTAAQSVKHPWLVKKPSKLKPPPEKKKLKEKPKLKEKEQNSVSPVEELDMTKDNLRLFVERWSEHPNSPYIFDKSNHEISHCLSNSTRQGTQVPDYEYSVGGCSPSPCSSLNSSPDAVQEENISVKNPSKIESHNSKSKLYVSTLERRASDSSCFIHKKADICLRVNLAEEIKKLSDHLFKLSTMNTDIVINSTDNNNKINSSKCKENNQSSQTIVEAEANIESNVSQAEVKGNNVTKTRVKSNSIKTTFIIDDDNAEYVGSNLPWAKPGRTKFKMTGMNRDVPIMDKKQTSFGDEFNRRRESINKFISSNSEENENYTTSKESNTQSTSKVTQNVEMSKSSRSSRTTTVKTKVTSSNNSVQFQNSTMSSRTDMSNGQSENATNFESNKFGASQTNTQIANGVSNGVNEDKRSRHFYKSNTEETLSSNAHDTKDLLLSLLDQWDENQTQQPQQNMRHKSVSMEWSQSDSLAQKSLNTFFTKHTSNNETVKKKQENIVKTNGFK